MKLIFDPNPPSIISCKVTGGKYFVEKYNFLPEWYKKFDIDSVSKRSIEAIGYVLHNGGKYIDKTTSLLTADNLNKIEKCVELLPEYNDMTFKIAKYWVTNLPRIPHVLLCDTAFFKNLPDEVHAYALPYELLKKGLRKYGSSGICHQWAWEQMRLSSNNKIKKLISIYIGGHTNIAAINNGLPFETSVGFTPAEGILSATGCGDIDPTIVFLLQSAGFSFKEINDLLSKKSGFTGLFGKKCTYKYLINGKEGPKLLLIRNIFIYNILKYIGAFISVLGGVDGIVFTGDSVNESMQIINEICSKLGFLGLKLLKTPEENDRYFNLTEGDSAIAVMCFKQNHWKILDDEIKKIIY